MKQNFRQGNIVAHHLAKDALNLTTFNKTQVPAAPPFCVLESLEKDAEGITTFVKYLSTDVCNVLATMGNQSVLSDTTLPCNQCSLSDAIMICNRMILF